MVKRPFPPAAAVALIPLVAVLDQLSKYWATRHLAGRPPLPVVEHFFHLTYHRNAGGLFGIFGGPPTPGKQLFFVGASVLALVLILFLIRGWGGESPVARVGLGLVGGGAVGNLIDRILHGAVIDFIDWHWRGHHWPAFNVADSAITVGAVLLVLQSLGREGHASEGDRSVTRISEDGAASGKGNGP